VYYDNTDYGSANSEIKTFKVSTYKDCANACSQDACCQCVPQNDASSGAMPHPLLGPSAPCVLLTLGLLPHYCCLTLLPHSPGASPVCSYWVFSKGADGTCYLKGDQGKAFFMKKGYVAGTHPGIRTSILRQAARRLAV
jgi:hypothetical protein